MWRLFVLCLFCGRSLGNEWDGETEWSNPHASLSVDRRSATLSDELRRRKRSMSGTYCLGVCCRWNLSELSASASVPIRWTITVREKPSEPIYVGLLQRWANAPDWKDTSDYDSKNAFYFSLAPAWSGQLVLRKWGSILPGSSSSEFPLERDTRLRALADDQLLPKSIDRFEQQMRVAQFDFELHDRETLHMSLNGVRIATFSSPHFADATPMAAIRFYEPFLPPAPRLQASMRIDTPISYDIHPQTHQ